MKVEYVFEKYIGEVQLWFWMEIVSRVSVIHVLNVVWFVRGQVRARAECLHWDLSWVWPGRERGEREARDDNNYQDSEIIGRFVCDSSALRFLVMLSMMSVHWSQDSLTEVRRPQRPDLVWAQFLSSLSLSPDPGPGPRRLAAAGSGSGPGPHQADTGSHGHCLVAQRKYNI